VTDKQTQRHNDIIYRANIASRGKMCAFVVSETYCALATYCDDALYMFTFTFVVFFISKLLRWPQPATCRNNVRLVERAVQRVNGVDGDVCPYVSVFLSVPSFSLPLSALVIN